MAESPKERVLTTLRQQILQLVFAPGTALDEQQLAAEHGLSRTPLREVFQRLAGEGYITLEANRGATVASMDLVTMRHFFRAAPMIYAAIARLAAESVTGEQIDSLRSIQDAFAHAMDENDAQAMSEHNHRFHETLGAIAASPYLTPSLNRLLIDHTRMSHRFYRVRKSTSMARVREASMQHEAMIDALEQHDVERAVELTLAHWELSRQEIDKYVLPDPLPLDTALAGESPDVTHRAVMAS